MKEKVLKVVSICIMLSLLFIIPLVFTGCGTPDNLESYIAVNKEAAKSFEKLQSAASSSGMQIDVRENTLIYTCRYTDTYKGSTLNQMKTTIRDKMADSQERFSDIANTFEQESGIDGVIVQVIFENGDGTEIFNREYQ